MTLLKALRNLQSHTPPVRGIMKYVHVWSDKKERFGNAYGHPLTCWFCSLNFVVGDKIYNMIHFMCAFGGNGNIVGIKVPLVQLKDLPAYQPFAEFEHKYQIDFDFMIELKNRSVLKLGLYEERGAFVPMAMVMTSKPKFKRTIDRLKVMDAQYRLVDKTSF